MNMMSDVINKAGLQVAEPLATFLEQQALPGTGVAPDAFWAGVADIYARFAPENARLLSVRDDMQARIDGWHQERAGRPIDMAEYQAFLREIGYLVEEPAPFAIAPTKVDDEVARIAGPQLVVPILNARFLLNAANARWGSLYDALYGTDAIPGTAQGSGYDAKRGEQVIAPRHWLRVAGEIMRGTCQSWPIPRNWSAGPVTTCCCGTTICTSKWSSTGITPSAGTTRRGSRMWCWNPRCRPSATWKIPLRRWTLQTRLPLMPIGSA
jgi:malate synthase